MFKSIRRLSAGLGLLSAVALSGCLSVLPTPQAPIALISLPSGSAGAPTASLQSDVTIYPPDAPRSYAGVDIAVSQGQELVYLADVRWADAAPRLLQGSLLDSLSGAPGQGKALSAQQGASTDYDLRWRILDLSVSRGTRGVTAVVEASLLNSKTRRVVVQERFTSVETPSGRSPRERAAALAKASQAVCDLVADFVVRHAIPLEGQPPPRAASSSR